MTPFRKKMLNAFPFVLVPCLLLFCTLSAAQTPVNGGLQQVGNQQVLTLWGSHYEMGYAHGYLTADKIRDLIDTFFIGVLCNGNVSDYNYRLTLIPIYHTFYPEYADEIDGMVAGMVASGKSLYVSRLGRNIDSRDIKAWNLFAELYLGNCSAFAVWGNSTANGETITARNYDFFYDSQGKVLNNQMLMVYKPTGKRKFVSFGWPGWIGVTTAVNETGVDVMLNGGNGSSLEGNGPFHPVTEIARYLIENTSPDNFLTEPSSVESSVYQWVPMITEISSPSVSGAGNPVYYIENAGDHNVTRFAADTDPQRNFIIATNHFVKLTKPPSSGDSITRYNSLKTGLTNLLGSGDLKVDSNEAWSLLNGVADIVAPTLTSIVIRPNRQELDVSLAAMVSGKVVTATHRQPQSYTFAQLFNADGPIITASAGTGGSISPSGYVLVNQGSSQTFVITPSAGYTISSVSVDGVSQGVISSYTFSNVTSNHTITAAFTAVKAYTITASAGTGGSISPSGYVLVNQGSSQTFTIAPNLGYRISSVTVDRRLRGAISSYTFSNVTSNHTITAAFTAVKTYTITATAGTGGYISPSGNVLVNQGSSQTFTITPGAGYTISSVSVDGVSQGAVSSYTFNAITANHTITAAFTETSTPVLTSISVAPASAAVTANGVQQFAATAKDQSGNVLSPQPSFTWSTSGGGTITDSGLFAAGSSAGGPYVITATSGDVSGTATVTVTTIASINIGETGILGSNDNGNGNLLVAQRATLGQTATIVSMSFYVTTTGGSLRLGIYDATGSSGGPGRLRAQSASFTPVAGWNTVNVISPVSLTAGTYWIAYLPSSNSLGFRKAPTGSARFYPYAYGALPSTFPASPSSETVHWSFYATLQSAN